MNGKKKCYNCGFCQSITFGNGYLYYCKSIKWYVDEFHVCMWWKPIYKKEIKKK